MKSLTGKFKFWDFILRLRAGLMVENVRIGECDFCSQAAITGRGLQGGDVFYLCEPHKERL